jgi:hypothetical protein
VPRGEAHRNSPHTQNRLFAHVAAHTIASSNSVARNRRGTMPSKPMWIGLGEKSIETMPSPVDEQ